MEKCAILESYKQFLKLCNFDMQIIIQTDNIDLENHFFKINEFKSLNANLSDMAEDYINLIKNISKERESIARKFYIVVKNKERNVKEKIESTLSNCGNIVSKCSKTEILKILKRYFKKNAGARKEARWV